MKLVLALALATAPSGLAMGPFVPYDSECPKVPGLCKGTMGEKMCSEEGGEGYGCHRRVVCGTDEGFCLTCQNCIGFDTDGDRPTGTIWAIACCPEPPSCPGDGSVPDGCLFANSAAPTTTPAPTQYWKRKDGADLQ